MKKTIRSLFAVILVLSVIMSMMSINVYAEELGTEPAYICGKTVHTHVAECWQDNLICPVEEHIHVFDCLEKEPNIWYGDEISYDVTEGKDSYTFMSVYPGRAYEMSNHMVTSGDGNSIPQTLVMIEADRDYTWSPDGIYTFGSSNYEVMYCCDEHTGYNDSVYYKRMNLEDSSYYDEAAAAHIRAIITNSYPFVSLEQMKANLAAEGFADAYALSRADVIAAVQTAVWAYANDAAALRYSQTFHVPDNSQWGTVFHDYTNEMEVWWETGYRVASVNEDAAARINSLANHLKSREKMYADAYQVVITDLNIVDIVPIQEKDGVFNVIVQVVLNNGGSSMQDDIRIEVSVDGESVETVKAELGKTVYDISVPVNAGQSVEAVVSGTQILPEGVYFYEPEGGRSVSQSLVGVAAGATAVYAKAEAVPVLLQENPVTADLKLQKIGESGELLSGASFALEAVKGEAVYCIGSYAVDEAGKLTVENLLPGFYRLTETAAPEGYQRLVSPVGFSVSEAGEICLDENGASDVFFSGGVIHVRNHPAEVVPPYEPPYEPPYVPPYNPEPPVPEVPEPEAELPEEELEVPEVPLAEEPAAEIEIEEEEVPLTDVPKTGDNSAAFLWMMMALLSAAVLVGARIAERKEK